MMPSVKFELGSWKPGVIVIICNLVEPEIHVGPGSDPFGTVNRAGFEGSDDLATGDRHHGGAHAAHDFGAETRHAIAQPLVVLRTVDFLGEPAAHLRAGLRGHQRLDVERRVDFVPQLLASAEVNPRSELVGGQTKQHCAKEIQRRRLALKIRIEGMIHISDTGADRIERL